MSSTSLVSTTCLEQVGTLTLKARANDATEHCNPEKDTNVNLASRAAEATRVRHHKRQNRPQSLDIGKANALTATTSTLISPHDDLPARLTRRNVSPLPADMGAIEQRSRSLLDPNFLASPPFSPTISRIPPHIRQGFSSTHSLPVLSQRPLSDGPSGYSYMPVSARPVGYETFGPFDQYPRSPRRSFISRAGMICEADEEANRRITEHVFTYTPDGEHVVGVEKGKKVKWFSKGSKKLKRLFKYGDKQVRG